jgi:hypothetical protein
MGDRKPKPWRTPLEKDWAQALLSEWEKAEDGDRTSAFQSLRQARENYEAALNRARKALGRHPLLGIAAQEAARRHGKRGDPRIVIDDDGRVMLEVRYGTAPKPSVSSLPSLDELRKRAEKDGIDISDLGRAKKKILKRLEGETPKLKSKSKTPKTPKKMTKTAPAVGPVRLVSLPDPEPKKEAVAIRPGSMAAVAAEGAKASENLHDFLAGLDEEYEP